MNSTENANGLISILKVLDICIEMETNAATTYEKLAHEAEGNGVRALLAWLYNVEGTRLRKIAERRRTILQVHPGLISSGLYERRQDTGLSKMGWGKTWLSRSKPLDILRYAIDNEVRAMQFFRRKAATARVPALRMMFNAAMAEQQDQIEYFGAQREVLMQQQINSGVEQLAEVVA